MNNYKLKLVIKLNIYPFAKSSNDVVLLGDMTVNFPKFFMTFT